MRLQVYIRHARGRGPGARFLPGFLAAPQVFLPVVFSGSADSSSSTFSSVSFLFEKEKRPCWYPARNTTRPGATDANHAHQAIDA